MSHKLEVERHAVVNIFFRRLACRTSRSQVKNICDMICDKKDGHGDRLRSRLDIGTGHITAARRTECRRLLADLLRERLGGETGSARASENARSYPNRRCRYRNPAGSTGAIDDRSPAHRREDRGGRSWFDILGRAMGRHNDTGREDDPDGVRSTGRLREITDPGSDIIRESCSEGQRGQIRTTASTDTGADRTRPGTAGDEIGFRNRTIAGSTPSNHLQSVERLSPQGIIETHESDAKDSRNRGMRA